MLGSLLFVFNNCSSIIAEDIKGENIVVILPLEGDVITNNSVDFKWESVASADSYVIQIATPNFTNPTAYPVDSLVTDNNINFVLSPNNYQWRVKAKNNISETSFSNAIDFTVDEIINLTDQTLVLNTPLDDIYLNSLQQNFTWDYLTASDYYLFQLVKGDEFSNEIIEQATTENNFYLPSATNIDDAIYTWKVKAVNSFSETVFSFRKFNFDTVLPNTPILLSPANQETSTVNTVFNWNLGVDSGVIQSPIKSIVEFSTTNNFNVLFDSIEVNSNELNYTFATTGTFFWRVKAIDAANNISLYSEVREITIQ